MSKIIQVEVDQGLCLSSETCASRSELFTHSADRLVQLKGPDGAISTGPIIVRDDQLAAVRYAEESCPAGAITVIVDEDDHG